jgi:hypothetical protein
MREGRGSPNPLEHRGALGGAERGTAIVVFRGGVDETGSSGTRSAETMVTGLPSNTGCCTSSVVTMAVESFRRTHTALGEVLPAFGKGIGRLSGSAGIGIGIGI